MRAHLLSILGLTFACGQASPDSFCVDPQEEVVASEDLPPDIASDMNALSGTKTLTGAWWDASAATLTTTVEWDVASMTRLRFDSAEDGQTCPDHYMVPARLTWEMDGAPSGNSDWKLQELPAAGADFGGASTLSSWSADVTLPPDAPAMPCTMILHHSRQTDDHVSAELVLEPLSGDATQAVTLASFGEPQ